MSILATKVAVAAGVAALIAVPAVVQTVAPQTLPDGLTFGWADITRLLEVAAAVFAVGKWVLLPHLRSGVRSAIAAELDELGLLKGITERLVIELKEGTEATRLNTAEIILLRATTEAASQVAATVSEKIADLKIRMTQVEAEQDEERERPPRPKRRPQRRPG
jgi:hypothetical protein